MLPQYVSVVVLMLISSCISCPLGKVRGCSVDVDFAVEICTDVGEEELGWLPVCFENANEVVRCLEGLCGTFPLAFSGKKGVDKCCIPHVIIRTEKSNSSKCENENKLCCLTDRVICASVHTDIQTVEYILGGTMVLVMVIGIFLGWVISFCYWAIRKPRYDENLDSLIQSRLETNTYALVPPQQMVQINRNKPLRNGKVELIPPDASSINSETQMKTDIYQELNPVDEVKEKDSSETPTTTTIPGNETGEKHKQELVNELVTNHKIPPEATATVSDGQLLIDFGTEEVEVKQQSVKVEETGNKDGDTKPLLSDDVVQTEQTTKPVETITKQQGFEGSSDKDGDTKPLLSDDAVQSDQTTKPVETVMEQQVSEGSGNKDSDTKPLLSDVDDAIEQTEAPMERAMEQQVLEGAGNKDGDTKPLLSDADDAIEQTEAPTERAMEQQVLEGAGNKDGDSKPLLSDADNPVQSEQTEPRYVQLDKFVGKQE